MKYILFVGKGFKLGKVLIMPFILNGLKQPVSIELLIQ